MSKLLALALCSALLAGDPPQRPDPKIPADTEVVTTSSGLAYSVLAPGRGGPAPKLGDMVRVHYSGWLADGKVFDSSVQRGEPMDLYVGQVIPGWNEALALMTPGARLKLTVPPKLGWGDKPEGPIPANSTLVFELELLEHASLPELHPLDPEKAIKTESGLEYQVLKPGAGEAPREVDAFEMGHALWSPAGKLLDWAPTWKPQIKGRAQDVSMPFLREAALLMQPGARYRFVVPPQLAYGSTAKGRDLPADSITTWELELARVLRPLPIPPFAPLDSALAQKTASGLLYEVVREGTGSSPVLRLPNAEGPGHADKVSLHYAGWTAEGTLFDSSYQRGEPASMRLGKVIDGWNEGLQLMREGAIYKLQIPPDLGYGGRAMGPIPANSTLVFYIELIDVQG